MSRLWVYDETGRELESDARQADIARKLGDIDVVFEQWRAERRLAANAAPE